MIIGLLSETEKQRAILPAAVWQALRQLRALDLSALAPGKYEIDGERLFYLVQEATPRLVADSLAEAHRDYADVQIPVGATERFGFSLPQAGLTPCEEDFAGRDIAFYPTPENEPFIDVAPGSYIVFWPGELHRPCVAIAETTPFRKVVVKIHASLLGLS